MVLTEKVYLSVGERFINLFEAIRVFFRGVIIGKEPVYNVDEGKWEVMSRAEALDVAYAYLEIFLCGYMYSCLLYTSPSPRD